MDRLGKGRKLGMDFNGTFFSHPKSADGFTLSHRERSVREFWIGHGIACRRIGAAMGKAVGSPCVCNVWIPDGYKDTPADRLAPGSAWRSRWTPFRGAAQSAAPAGRRREQALRHRVGKLRRRLA